MVQEKQKQGFFYQDSFLKLDTRLVGLSYNGSNISNLLIIFKPFAGFNTLYFVADNCSLHNGSRYINIFVQFWLTY